MLPFIGPLLANRKLIGFGILGVGLLGLFFHRTYLLNLISDRDKLILAQQVQILDLEAGKKTLINAIEARNRDVDKWKVVSDKLVLEAEKLESKIAGMKTSSDQQIRKILGGEKPKDCASAVKYLVKGVEELKWDE